MMQPSLDDSILQPYGGFHNNSLVDIIRLDDDLSNANEQLQTITHSSYYDNEKFTNFLATGNKYFSVFSSNIESINTKHAELELFIEQLKQQNFRFSAICLQECWLTNQNIESSLIGLEEYNCIEQSSNISNKGGYFIYLTDVYHDQYMIKQTYTLSPAYLIVG